MAFRRYTRLLALAPLLGLLSCQNLAELLGLSDPFALYRNPADNFIAASDLDRQDLTSTGFEGTAVWTWAWRGASDARDDSNPAGYPYMKLEPAGTVTAGSLEGVDHDVPAYRLGLVNLITGGDFEGANSSTAALAANGWKWKEDPASTDYNDLKAFEPTVTIGASGEHAISGNTLMVHVFGLPLGKNPVAFRYALASLAEAKGAMVSHTYSLRLLSGTGAEFYWQTAPTGTINYDATTYVKTTAKAEYVFPDFTWNPLAFADLVFGKPTTPFDFWFDNLRIIRTDIASDYRLRLLLKPKDTAPDLVHGRGWKYTLWIRKPPGQLFPSEAGAAEPFAAQYVSLRIMQTVTSEQGAGIPASDIVNEVPSNGQWTRLELRITNDSSTLDFPTSSASAVLELSIFPFDYKSPTVGTVEIADPELHFSLNNQW
jgi:hypothetical protein